MNMTMNMNNPSLAGDMKPMDEVQQLMSEIGENVMPVSAKMGEVIKFTTEKGQRCIVLHKGSIAIHRRGDGMIIASEKAPFIFGLNNQPGVSDSMYLRTLEPCELSFVPQQSANDIISTKELWEPVVKVVLYITSQVFEHCSQIHQMSAYDIIRYQLNELSHESDAVRLNTTVAKYIKSRTYLSRSGIMRILSELRTGNYISIEKGVLTEINHLPKKF